MSKTITSPKTTSAAKNSKKVEFEFYAPQSKKVQVAGSFNSWNPGKTPLKQGRDGKWKASVSLSPGRYEYKFLVDGDWQNDQKPVECVPNNLGGWNCVIEVQ